MECVRYNLTEETDRSDFSQLPGCPYCGWKWPKLSVRVFGFDNVKRPFSVVEMGCRNPRCWIHEPKDFPTVGDAIVAWCERPKDEEAGQQLKEES